MENLFEIRFDATSSAQEDFNQQMKILSSLKNSHNEVAYIAPNGTVLNITTEYNYFVLTKNEKLSERFPYGLEDQLHKRLRENLQANPNYTLAIENEYKLIGPEDLIKVTAHLHSTDSHQFENEQEYLDRIRGSAERERNTYRSNWIAYSGASIGVGLSLLSLGASLKVASIGFKLAATSLGTTTIVNPINILSVPFSQGALGLSAAGLVVAALVYSNQSKRLKSALEALTKVGKTVEKYSEKVHISNYQNASTVEHGTSNHILDNITVRTVGTNHNDKAKRGDGAA